MVGDVWTIWNQIKSELISISKIAEEFIGLYSASTTVLTLNLIKASC